jgi:hypothetical protein
MFAAEGAWGAAEVGLADGAWGATEAFGAVAALGVCSWAWLGLSQTTPQLILAA